MTNFPPSAGIVLETKSRGGLLQRPPTMKLNELPTIGFSLTLPYPLFFFLVLSFVMSSCGEIEISTTSDSRDEATVTGNSSTESGTDAPGTTDTDDDSSNSDNLPPSSECIIVDVLPTPCSIWQNHIVALVTSVSKRASASSSEAIVTLISLYDWAELPSALNVDNPTLAPSIAQGYQEYDLNDWRIPTADEAKALKTAYSQFADCPDLWDEVGALPFDASARYLCAEGQKSFSFAPGTTISAAGTKATTYRLRLVKTLRFKQK